MAAIVQIPGPAQISLNTGASSALAIWGFTENGAVIREEMLKIDVPGDQNGGDAGNPIEIQDLGRVGRVHLEMSKWDEAVSEFVQAKVNPNGTAITGPPNSPTTQGVSPVPGLLLFSNTYYFRLLVKPLTPAAAANTLFVRNFLIAIPIEAHEINLGTRYARFVSDWICYPPVGGGTYWNTTST